MRTKCLKVFSALLFLSSLVSPFISSSGVSAFSGWGNPGSICEQPTSPTYESLKSTFTTRWPSINFEINDSWIMYNDGVYWWVAYSQEGEGQIELNNVADPGNYAIRKYLGDGVVYKYRSTGFNNNATAVDSLQCIADGHNVHYDASNITPTIPDHTFPPPPPTPCEYNSSILASDPACVPPSDPPSDPPSAGSETISFVQKISVAIALAITGVIAYQFRFRMDSR